MCIEVRVQVGDALNDCDTVDLLRQALPKGIVVTEFEGDSCLCPVDLDATAAANGMLLRDATEAEGWPFPEYVMESGESE